MRQASFGDYVEDCVWYFRWRLVLLVCGLSIISGAWLFQVGCDEVLKPWCTENRHSSWQAVAKQGWEVPPASRQPWPCDPVNAWLCSVADGASTATMVVLFQSVGDGHGTGRLCNMTLPTVLARTALSSNATVLTLWPKFPQLGQYDGCRLQSTRRDIFFARVGFGLLWVPVGICIAVAWIKCEVVDCAATAAAATTAAAVAVDSDMSTVSVSLA